MKLNRVHHIAINTLNIEESVQFYQELFGFYQKFPELTWRLHTRLALYLKSSKKTPFLESVIDCRGV
ncbi:MAG: VOC family protein [Oscillospiraceae bacterium]